ncbi:MAG: hypothetical protein HY292_25940 [Planctomycetes bacterium]|nr:hypothetical protein [Planctomycetota bacterium]
MGRAVVGAMLIAASISIGLADTARAQGTWTGFTPPLQPSARSATAMVYDAALGQSVLFGGFDDANGVPVDETWTWDGTAWNIVRTAHTPGQRSQHAMAYDSLRSRVVLFGGVDPNGPLGDTWEFDGTDWTSVGPATTPSARGQHAMAYDSLRHRTVLFGGIDANGILGDTWEWDGTQWTIALPPVSPAPLFGHAMAFDSARNRTVLFGGHPLCMPGRCFPSGETWEWDGTNWVQWVPVHSPNPRTTHVMTFDTLRGRTVLFGGITCGEVLRCTTWDDTWLWDGSDWSPLTTAQMPPPRELSAMAYDSPRGQTVLFGGDLDGTDYNDTWELNRPLQATAILPATGSSRGGELTSVFATPLAEMAGTTVTIGGNPASVVQILSNRVTVRTPAGTGVADVTISSVFGTFTLPAAYTYVDPAIAARFGNVNVGLGDRESVLLVNGNTGDIDRELTSHVGQPLDVYMQSPSSRATSSFALYVWIGVPSPSSLTTIPHGLGSMIFPTPFAGTTPQPRVIFNNLGHDALLGAPSFPSTAAPAPVFSRAGGAQARLNLAFQGIIQDDGSASARGFSITNAVILHVLP